MKLTPPRSVLFLVLPLLCAAGCAATPPPSADAPTIRGASQATPAASPTSCVEGYVRDVFNRGDVAAADRYFDAALVDHAPWPRHPATLAGFKAGLVELRAAFPDLDVRVNRTVAEGELVAVHMSLRGTQRGAYLGAPPTGKRIDVEAMDIVRVSGGKVVEHWGVLDAAAMAEQLGAAK